MIDFDSKRPAGISATDAEHNAALTRATDCCTWFKDLGFLGVILADSGNGGHLMVRIDLPNDADATKLIKRCLAAVALRYGDETVAVDLTVHNPARIWKLYGTKAVKGDNTADRPHRISQILDVQAPHLPAPRDLLEYLAGLAPEEPKNHSQHSARAQKFDLEPWITSHRLDVRGPFDWNGGRKWIFDTCP